MNPVRRPQVGELGEQIAVRTYFIPGHLSVCEDGQNDISGVVGECPATVREGGGTLGIITQDIRQHCPCDSFCFLRRVPTRMLKRVRESSDETGIVHRVASNVGSPLLFGETEDNEELQGPRSTLRLDPAPNRAVRRNQRAMP